MLNNIVNLTEGDLHRIVREVLNESRLGLLEYHSQQRLPFDDDFYGKKNQAEQYLDWLEEFGKYGKIGNSSLVFQDCVESGVKMAIEKKRIDSFASIDNIVNKLMDKFKHIILDNRNNIYVERSIKISDSIDSVAIDLFSSLTDKYENNVGGCWAFRSGMGYAYCTRVGGSQLLLKGWIRLEDVDWLKTCDLNYNNNEFEIRVKPNAKVELFEVIADGKYKLPLHDTLVVSSTYFGNNRIYDGDFVTVDDGMGHVTLINRKGEYLYPDLWFDEIGYFENGFAIVRLEDKGCNFIKQDGSLLCPNQWFDRVDNFVNGFAKVELYDKGCNFIKPDGSYLSPNQWFYEADDFYNGFAKIEIEDKGWNFIKPDGTYLSPNKWFDEICDFRNGFASVRIKDKVYKLSQDGKLVSYDQWWNELVNDALQRLENGEDPEDIFNYVGKFSEGFVRVELDMKYNFITQDRKLLSPNKWFYYADDFNNGFARVFIRSKVYDLSQDGKLYDLDGNLVESRKLRNSYFHRVLNESIKKVLKGNIYRR